MDKGLNVVYIGSPTFPFGGAMSKRWRYMVDYMNAHDVQSHVMVCHYKIESPYQNPVKGIYGMADYRDLRLLFVQRKIWSFYCEGKEQLKSWYKSDKKNVIIFTTKLSLLLLPFFMCARILGYKTVFDQVETSMRFSGKMRLRRKINEYLSDKISSYAYKRSASFVISSGLWRQNKEKYSDMPLCILPNSSIDLMKERKTNLHTPLRVLYSGTFAQKDGVKYLIDGVIEAYERGCNLELILIGKGQPWEMKVLDKIKNKPWIKYLGFISDKELISNIQNADVLCMTRNNSVFANFGFPFKLSEYIATGNILLTTRVGDVERYVRDKKSAFIIDPENVSKIAEALCYIEQHPQEALHVSWRGHDVMQQYFSIENVGETFIKFLLSI